MLLCPQAHHLGLTSDLSLGLEHSSVWALTYVQLSASRLKCMC